MARILLVQPPMANLAIPPLGIPSLRAFLARRGHEAAQADLSVELFDELLTPPHLEEAYAHVAGTFNQLNAEPALDLPRALRLYQTTEIHMAADYVLSHMEEARAYLKRPAPEIDHRAYRHAAGVVDAACRALSARLAPLTIFRHTLRLSHGFLQRHASLDDPFWMHNPAVGFLRRRLGELLGGERPAAVGLSLCFSSQLAFTLLIAQIVKRIDPACRVIVGGHLVGSCRELLIDGLDILRTVDLLIEGEGEIPLLRTLEFIDGRATLESVPNAIRARGGDVMEGPPHAPPPMDDLPTPDFGGLPLDAYWTKNPTLPLQTARGCYWRRCSFCGLHAHPGSGYRPRSLELVLEDITALEQRHGISSVYFVDACMNPRTAEALAAAIEGAGIPVDWLADMRFEPALTRETIQGLARGGCRYLLFGLESGSQRILEKMRKGTDLSTAARILRDCRDAGILTHCFVLANFPTETADELKQTFAFLEENADSVDSVGFSLFELERGSPIWSDPAGFGVSRVTVRPNGSVAFEVEGGLERQRAREMVDEFRHESEDLYIPPPIVDRTNFLRLKRDRASRYAPDSLSLHARGRGGADEPVRLRYRKNDTFFHMTCRFDLREIGKSLEAEQSSSIAERRDAVSEGSETSFSPSGEPGVVMRGLLTPSGEYLVADRRLRVIFDLADECSSFAELEHHVGADMVGKLKAIEFFERAEPMDLGGEAAVESPPS